MEVTVVRQWWNAEYEMLLERAYHLLYGGGNSCYGEGAFLRFVASEEFTFAGKGMYRNVFVFNHLPLVVKIPRWGWRRSVTDSVVQTELEFQIAAAFAPHEGERVVVPVVARAELPDGTPFTIQQVAMKSKHKHSMDNLGGMIGKVTKLAESLGGNGSGVWDTHAGNVVYDPSIGTRARDYSWDLGIPERYWRRSLETFTFTP